MQGFLSNQVIIKSLADYMNRYANAFKLLFGRLLIRILTDHTEAFVCIFACTYSQQEI